MVENFLAGLLLGYGAAIPIGAVNLEITRRNLHFGTAHGVSTGLGACSADLIYLLLLSFGLLVVAQQPIILRSVSLIGALILLWFAYQTITSPIANDSKTEHVKSHHRNWLEGFLMTMLNPYTILFWLSVSSQLVSSADSYTRSLWVTGLGLIVGTTSWVFFLNGLLHKTRHRIGDNVIVWLNRVGAFILFAFALMGIRRAFIGFA